MKVRDRLLSVLTDVEDESIAAITNAFVGDDLLREFHEFVEHPTMVRRHVIDAGDMAFGDHEDMDRRLRRYVMKGKRGVALGDDLRGYLPRDYFAEKAVTHLVLSSLLILRAVQRKSPATSLEGQKRRRNHTRGLCS